MKVDPIILIFGLVGQFPWWAYVIIALVVTHMTIASVTLYLHRSMVHGSVDFSPIVQYFFRFWLWLTTGMNTKEWVMVHRKHHAKCETVDDPHSPQMLGIWRLLTDGKGLYEDEIKRGDAVIYIQGKYAKGLPDDWVEHSLYSKYKWLGLVILGVVQTLVLGLPGLIIFGIQAYWIPIWAAGVINGLGHYWGYRNFETLDASRNIFPWGIFIGGEELHNNHHANQTSAKLSYKWYEFDIGWVYIRILEFFGLATVNRVDCFPVSVCGDTPLERESFFKLFCEHRYYIAKIFAQFPKARIEDSKNRTLRKYFKEWLKGSEITVTPFELEQWVGQVNQYGNSELTEFVSWLRVLHKSPDSIG